MFNVVLKHFTMHFIHKPTGTSVLVHACMHRPECKTADLFWSGRTDDWYLCGNYYINVAVRERIVLHSTEARCWGVLVEPSRPKLTWEKGEQNTTKSVKAWKSNVIQAICMENFGDAIYIIKMPGYTSLPLVLLPVIIQYESALRLKSWSSSTFIPYLLILWSLSVWMYRYVSVYMFVHRINMCEYVQSCFPETIRFSFYWYIPEVYSSHHIF